MSLFSNPVTVLTDRVLTFIHQTSDRNSIIFNWKEKAQPIADDSSVVIKQSRSRDIIRFLLKRSRKHTLTPEPASGPLSKAAQWNLTFSGDSRLTEAQVQEELDIILALAQQPGFVAGVLNGEG